MSPVATLGGDNHRRGMRSQPHGLVQSILNNKCKTQVRWATDAHYDFHTAIGLRHCPVLSLTPAQCMWDPLLPHHPI